MKYTCIKRFKTAHCLAYPVASSEGYGLIKLGDGLEVDEEGKVNVVSGGVPVLDKGNFIVGGEGGNEFRELRPTDLKVNINTNLNVPVQYDGDKFYEGGAQIGTSTQGGTLPIRDGRGALKSAFPQSNNDVVDYSTFMPTVNDQLPVDVDNAMLNILYGNAPIGKIIINPSPTINYMWLKYTATLWKKIKLEDVS